MFERLIRRAKPTRWDAGHEEFNARIRGGDIPKVALPTRERIEAAMRVAGVAYTPKGTTFMKKEPR